MSEGAEIPITIIIQQKGAEQVRRQIDSLVQSLTNLTMQAEALRSPLSSVTRSFVQLGRGVSSSFVRLHRGMTIIADNIRILERFNTRMNQLKETNTKVKDVMVKLSKEVGYQPKLWNQLRDAVRNAEGTTRADIALVTRAEKVYARLSESIKGFGIKTVDAYNIFRTAASQAGVSVRELADAFNTARVIQERFGIAISRTPEQLVAAHRNFALLTRVSEQTGISLEAMNRLFPKVFASLVTGTETSEIAIRNFMTNIKELSIVTRQLGVPLEAIAGIIRQTPEGIRVATEGLRTFAAALQSAGIRGSLATRMFLDSILRLARGVSPALEGMRLMTEGFCRMERGAYLVVRQLFWVGLGTMFLIMSLDRLKRRQTILRREILQLIRAEMRLQELQKEYTETVRAYGAGSEEARRKLRDLRFAEMQLEMQRQDLIDSTRQLGFANAMFWASAVAQVVGSGAVIAQGLTDLMLGYYNVAIGAGTAQGTIEAQGNAAVVAGAKNLALKSSIDLTNLSFWQMFKVAILGARGLEMTGWAALKAGLKIALARAFVSGLIGALIMVPTILAAYAYATHIAAQKTDELNRKYRELRQTLAGSGLEEDLSIVTQRLDELTERTKRSRIVLDKFFAGLSGRDIRLTPKVTITKREEETHVRKVYEEIRHVREGLGIHSPGLQIEIPELEKAMREREKIFMPVYINIQVQERIDEHRMLAKIRKEMLSTLKAAGVS